MRGLMARAHTVIVFLFSYFSASGKAFVTPFSRSPCLRRIARMSTALDGALSGKVAVVTGASRGIGKGIALELGAAGATVYVAGRSTREGGMSTERAVGDGVTDMTIEATCEAIDHVGGKGIPVRLDAINDKEIQALLEKVESEQGRLDVLVCSAFTTPPSLTDAKFRDDFWKQGAAMWDACNQVGLRSVYLQCCAAVPLMIQTAKKSDAITSRPLIVLISSFGGKSYTFNVAYGVGKAAIDRLANDMHWQLLAHGVDTVSLYPGLVATEANQEMVKRGEWEEASGGFDLAQGETPRFSGAAVTRLATSPTIMEPRSGSVQVVAELAKELGFTDENGNSPPSIRSLRFLLPNYVFPSIEKESGPVPSWIKDNVPDYLLPWSVFSGGPPPSNDD